MSSAHVGAPDISVVIVSYNICDLLSDCLRSIETASAGLAVEVIVVDNNSQDDTAAVIPTLFPWVRFVDVGSNIGFGKANNVGFGIATGGYILCLNPDTVLSSDTLRTMKQYMDEHPKVGISGCKLLNQDGTFQLACRRGFPTPWAAFSKIFGLQKLFPGSKLFGRYNQTWRSEDETYEVDAVSGAFMFLRREALLAVEGFDPDFFMYGEDLDLCYRIQRGGWSVVYVHTTTTLHYKGVSTSRSELNEVRVFYQAMEIFVRKHFSHSPAFLFFLRSGIWLRSFVASTAKAQDALFLAFVDICIVSCALLFSTWIRFGSAFGFPDFAYPTAIVAVSLITSVSMFFSGEYVPRRTNALLKTVFGYLTAFFILSALTYFFKDWAFSRGVLLLTIGLGIIGSVVVRVFLRIRAGKRKQGTRAILYGADSSIEALYRQLAGDKKLRYTIVGKVGPRISVAKQEVIPTVATESSLARFVRENDIDEILISGVGTQKEVFDRLQLHAQLSSVKIRVVSDASEIISAKVIEDLLGEGATTPRYEIAKPQYRVFKRVFDLVAGLFLLSIGLPLLYLFLEHPNIVLRDILRVMAGSQSLIGVYAESDESPMIAKRGLISLASIHDPGTLSEEAISRLNEYYIRQYTPVLDLEILITFLFRNKHRNL